MHDGNPRETIGAVELTPRLLRMLIEYHPETGNLFWLARPQSMFPSQARSKGWNTRYAGRPALNCPSHGYLYGRIFGESHFAHRVAWAISHGQWPDVIDHINGDKMDNRLRNLRDVPHRLNLRNCKLSASNSSGVTGVFWLSKRRKWQAGVKADGKYHYLGIFDDFEEAVAARKLGEEKYQFHKNHGRDK